MGRRIIPVVVAVLSASLAQAQVTNTSPSDLAGFRGLILTPAGAFPQLFLPNVRTERPYRATLALRFGQYKYADFEGSRRNVGVTGSVALNRRLRAGATAGRHSGPTDGDRAYLYSADVEASIYHKPARNMTGGDTDIGMLFSAGYGKPDSGNAAARSVWMSIPVAVTLPQQKAALSIFVAPSMGYGQLEVDGVSDGSVRPMFGAGATWAFDMGLAAHLTVHRIIVNESPTQIGFGASYTFGGGPPRSE